MMSVVDFIEIVEVEDSGMVFLALVFIFILSEIARMEVKYRYF